MDKHLTMQVKDCLKQNEELRGILDNLRTEQAKAFVEPLKNGVDNTGSSPYTTEVLTLKVGCRLNAAFVWYCYVHTCLVL